MDTVERTHRATRFGDLRGNSGKDANVSAMIRRPPHGAGTDGGEANERAPQTLVCIEVREGDASVAAATFR
jgi:hypothetical protein